MIIANLLHYFFKNDIHPNLQSNIGNHIGIECFKKILCISDIFGSRGGGIEILSMIDVKKCQFLAKSEN